MLHLTSVPIAVLLFAGCNGSMWDMPWASVSLASFSWRASGNASWCGCPVESYHPALKRMCKKAGSFRDPLESSLCEVAVSVYNITYISFVFVSEHMEDLDQARGLGPVVGLIHR